MVKSIKLRKYPDEEIKAPEGSSPRTKKRVRQHNYEVRMKQKAGVQPDAWRVRSKGRQMKGPDAPATGGTPQLKSKVVNKELNF